MILNFHVLSPYATYVAYEKIKIKEGNKLRQQILKEKDPAKYKEGQKEAKKKLREKLTVEIKSTWPTLCKLM